MTPLHASLPNPLRGAGKIARPATPAFFGSSSRNWEPGPRRSRDGDDNDSDDEDRPRPSTANTYRTMCVRLCDGYYFPISFSTTKDKFGRDAQKCERSCGTQARLFIYRNPGDNIEDMADLRGQPYKKLSGAFRYRTEYVANCRCQANPWDAETRERHRVYALVAAKNKGNRQAAAELAQLSVKSKQTLKPAPQMAAAPAVVSPRERQSYPSRQPLSDATKMSLGRGLAEPRPRLSRKSALSDREPEPRRRLFGER